LARLCQKKPPIETFVGTDVSFIGLLGCPFVDSARASAYQPDFEITIRAVDASRTASGHLDGVKR
jgi:hypothetical protein